jgi:protein associated with RNAse G/E
MSVYTHDVYLNNFSWWSCWITPPQLQLIETKSCPDLAYKRIAAVISYIRDPKTRSLIKNGRELDLCALRQRLVLDGHDRGIVDIYGRGWPDGLSRGTSSEGERRHWGKGVRHQWKISVLKDYQFNICLENTNFDYYCTEKVWEAIKGGCLPIYYGSDNRIYESFPKNSFIDVAEFESSKQMYGYIEDMDKFEYCDRMNKCIRTYNRFLTTDSFEAQFDRIVAALVERIKAIVSA